MGKSGIYIIKNNSNNKVYVDSQRMLKTEYMFTDILYNTIATIISIYRPLGTGMVNLLLFLK